MRPAMQPGVYCVDAHDGAYVVTPVGPLRLTGRSSAGWIRQVAPFLDGRATLADLVAELSPQRAAMVDQVVRTLHEAGAVRDLDASDPHGGTGAPLTADELREYAPELAYLSYLVPLPAPAHARHRDHVMLLVGWGPLLAPLLAAAVHSGLREVRVVAPPEQVAGLPEPALRDRNQRVSYLPTAGHADLRDPTRVHGLLSEVDLVLHAVGTEQPTGVVEGACAAAGIPLAQAVVAGGQIWLLPVSGAGDPGWSAAARRLATAPEPATAAAGGATDLAALTAAAARLIQDVYRFTSGAAPTGPRTHVVRAATTGYHQQRHRFVPHPFALPAAPTEGADLPTRVAALAGADRLVEDDFSRRAVQCLDPWLGLFSLTDNDWGQVPLQVCEAVVADPAGWLPSASRPRMSGSGFTHQAARCEAGLRALARYASLMVDPRRLVDPGTHRQLTTDTAADPRPGAALGVEVDAPQRVHAVPATSAFPVLTAPSTDLPVGVGAGYDWGEALTAGLVSHARALAVSALRRTTVTTYPLVDLTKAGDLLDEAGQRCRRLLDERDELPDCYDATHPAGVPTFAFCRGHATICVIGGATAGAALGDGLRRVLLSAQEKINGDVGYGPSPGPPLPAPRRGTLPEPVSRGREPRTPAQIAAELRRLGLVAVAVPLDHDPGVTAILPHLVQVVLVGGDGDA